MNIPRLNKRELLLFVLTATTAVAALGYVYVIEPRRAGGCSVADPVTTRYKRALSLYERRDALQRRMKEITEPSVWKTTVGEQQVMMQASLEEMCRKAGVAHLLSVYPMMMTEEGACREMAIQMNLQCSAEALTRFLHAVANARLPLQVRKLSVAGDADGMVRCQCEIAALWMPMDR